MQLDEQWNVLTLVMCVEPMLVVPKEEGQEK